MTPKGTPCSDSDSGVPGIAHHIKSKSERSKRSARIPLALLRSAQRYLHIHLEVTLVAAACSAAWLGRCTLL